MEQADRLELAIQNVNQALERVQAAWQADHPDLHVPEPAPAAWHPDPHQAPVTTRQWAQLARLRAASLCQAGLQIRAQAAQLQQATEELHTFLQRPMKQDDPGHFIRVGRAAYLPCAGQDPR